MCYNVELSVNILKHNDMYKLTELINHYVENQKCLNCYEDYEFENNLHYKRTNKVVTINFENDDNFNITKFIKNIKNIHGIHVESIYNDNSNSLLYASKYYLDFMVDKHIANSYRSNRRTRSYSEDDIKILKELNKNIN